MTNWFIHGCGRPINPDPPEHTHAQKVPLVRLLESYQPAQIKSHPVVRTDLYNGTALPSIAAFFSDAARVRLVPLLPPQPRMQEAKSWKPGERRQRQGQLQPWASVVESCLCDDQGVAGEEGGGHGQRRQSRPMLWVWVVLGLVGVGLTALGDFRGGDEEEEEAKGRR